jgi:hypothetical protein
MAEKSGFPGLGRGKPFWSTVFSYQEKKQHCSVSLLKIAAKRVYYEKRKRTSRRCLFKSILLIDDWPIH